MKTKQIDYYGTDANYIHLKFGNCIKMYNFTPDFITKHPLFAREYANYFMGRVSQFKNPFQVVNYVYKNKIPVHFYYNFTDTPAKNRSEIMDYLSNENGYMPDLK